MRMNIYTFKNWFAGFSDAVNGTPTKEQWDALTKVVDGLGGKSDLAKLQEQAMMQPSTNPYAQYANHDYRRRAIGQYPPNDWLALWC